MISRSPAADAEPLLVACLCASWCSLCTDYRAVFHSIAAADTSARYRWVDIEDEEALLGPIEVDDFPTLLLARGATVLFLGPLTPQPTTLTRLIDSARAGVLARIDTPEVIALAARIAAAPASLPAADRGASRA